MAGADEAKDGVILLHGIASVRLQMARIERALRVDGYATCNLGYPSCSKSIEALADHLHPRLSRFAAGVEGRVHFVTHSMGGLVARAWLARACPTNLGRFVMIGPPNGGSEVADLMQNWWAYRRAFGPAGGELTTAARAAHSKPPPCPVGVIAGDGGRGPLARVLPQPNDGRVSVAGSKLAGMADHVIVRSNHTMLPFDSRVVAQVRHFLAHERFSR